LPARLRDRGIRLRWDEQTGYDVAVLYPGLGFSLGALIRFIGDTRMIWASDFPHSDARYPGVVDELRANTRDLPDASRARLLGENALALYGIRT
jgi:hypothetical protein